MGEKTRLPRGAHESLARFGNGGGNGSDLSHLHLFIQGLVLKLPVPETEWSLDDRMKWLQTAANIFDLIYKGAGLRCALQQPNARRVLTNRTRTMKHALQTSLVVLLAVMTAPYSLASAKCLKLKYGPVTVTGYVFKRLDYGQPNFGNDPVHDSRVTNLYIRVDRPFCVDPDPAFYGAVADTHVRIMQMIYTTKIPIQWVGQHVSVTGDLAPWDNAYKTTPVGIIVKETRPFFKTGHYPKSGHSQI